MQPAVELQVGQGGAALRRIPAPSKRNAWGPVLQNETVFGVFGWMSATCASPPAMVGCRAESRERLPPSSALSV